MTRHHGLLLSVLVYLALDLSLPAMPGAFVFEAADSVEGIDLARGRALARGAPAPPPPAVRPVPVQLETQDRVRPAEAVERAHRPAARCRARSTCAPPPALEDSH